MRTSFVDSLFLLLLSVAPAFAQNMVSGTEPEVPIQRLELGGQYIYLGSTTCYYLADCKRPPAVAFGPAVAFNITHHLAVDVSFSTIVQQQQPPTAFYEGTVAGGTGTALMVGPRFELRRKRYGLFVFGQAGYQAWSQAPGPFVATSADGGTVYLRTSPARQTYFATGGGIGAEYTLTPRTHLRANVAERVVRYRPANSVVNRSTDTLPPDKWRKSEVFTAGVWVGIGSQVRGSGLLSEPVPSHRFLDRRNQLLILGANLAGITDAVVTRRFLNKGISEGDPIERPFVQNGIGEFIALGLITETATLGFMYGLHHMGHHFLERLLPAAIIIGEARTSYQVVKNSE